MYLTKKPRHAFGESTTGSSAFGKSQILVQPLYGVSFVSLLFYCAEICWVSPFISLFISCTIFTIKPILKFGIWVIILNFESCLSGEILLSCMLALLQMISVMAISRIPTILAILAAPSCELLSICSWS
jgi:hypothetical protein